uniref:Scaffold protein Nfu/NifU N-terminal domain-containing protein n=1 Tax=Ciona savignyi TaxID=51511 RepID=H2YDM8_CIOSA
MLLVYACTAPSINIHTMETEQGRGMIFHPGCPVLRGEQKMKYSSRHPCHHSPLVRQLLNITGVASVTLFPGHVHIEKSDDPPSLDWTSIKPRILATLIHFFSTKLPPTTHHLAKCKHRHKDNGECVTFGYLDDVEAIIDDLINSR